MALSLSQDTSAQPAQAGPRQQLRRVANVGWMGTHLVFCLMLVMPIVMIIALAFGLQQDSVNIDLMGHLASTVLPYYLLTTLQLMVGVGIVALLLGVSAAWVISRYDFAGRGVLEWALMLPAAMPAYLIAYAYTDFLEYSGPLQSGLRQIFGWQTARDYWFFEVRSLPVAAILMGAVLYPYIYLFARTAFRLTSTQLFEVAAISGQHIFWQVGLPLARPAIFAGLALVLMEVMSDFGTVDYFAIETITLGIFNVWLGNNDLAAAAQLSLFAFVLIGSIAGLEIYARSRRSFRTHAFQRTGVPRLAPSFGGQLACLSLCLLPLALGFLMPVGILVQFLLQGVTLDWSDEFLPLLSETLGLAFGGAILVMMGAVLMALNNTYRLPVRAKLVTSVGLAGYAFPGTILAIGVLGFVGLLDQIWMNLTGQILLGGSLGVLMLGYLVRFQAVGYGSVSSGLKRMPPFMMDASRSLGRGFLGSLWKVILPLLRNSILAGLLIVFVDVMKELPLTLLLRPFGIETFATFTYQYAKEEQIELAALPALSIVLAGLVPVIIANRALRDRRHTQPTNRHGLSE